MANEFKVKNGLVLPYAQFNSNDKSIDVNFYSTDTPSISFEGVSGQLFSITDDLSGTLFSVNDISGIPSIEVLDTGLVKIAEFSGNLVLGSAIDDGINKLQVNGTISATNFVSSGGELPVFIQNTQPTGITSKYIWVQTGLGAGSDFTFWFDDGV